MKSITVGKKVTCIEQEAFDNCSNLATVNYNGCEEGWNKIEIKSRNSKLQKATINIAGHDFINGVCSVCGLVCTHDSKPTCTEAAVCSICSEIFPATGHNYADPIFTWKIDNSATVTFICKNNNEHKLTYNCNVSSGTTKAAACLESGEITYTATCTFGNKEYTSKKNSTVSAAGHTDLNNDGYCDNCNATMKSSPVNPNANAAVNVADGRKVDYRTKVTIKATASGVDSKYKLAIYVGDKCVIGSNTEVTYNVGEIKGDIDYTVKVIDSSNNTAKDANGTEISKDGKISCNSGLFKRFAAFFKGLFNRLPSVTVEP